MREEPLTPFGLVVTLDDGTRWADLDVASLRAWIDAHRVVVLRGLAPLAPEALAAASRALGPLQPWPFGAVHELKRAADAENYLYTERAVPLHWDGAFADAVPHYLVFRCVAAPPPDAGGETTFVDTVAALARASAAQRARWERARVAYRTEKKAHYGGRFTSPVVTRHPTLGCPVMRYAEPVDDLNPVAATPLDLDAREAEALQRELREALYDPAVQLALPWRDGDVVVADNHALLHGRRAFRADAPRHLLRVNVLDPERRWWWGLRDAWRIRRPEFMRAEIPILLVPAMLSATRFEDLGRGVFLEGAALFFVLFQTGDLVNCLLDRDVDLHRKTHLAEAVRALGAANIKAQIAASALVALLLGAHLALTLARPWMAAAAVLGVALGASYTAPPLRLKGRGLAQLGAYVGLLFVGPMAMIAGLFTELPSPRVLLVSLAYGAMQTGVLLVNTAEDLDEDEREGIRTAAVALGAAGTMRASRALALVGGVALAALLAPRGAGPAWLVALAPLVATIAYNARWLTGLVTATRGVAEDVAREAIRKQGRYVPRHIEAGAWAALAAATAVLAARSR